jgi:polyphosphate kinase
MKTIIKAYLRDNIKARLLLTDGTYQLVPKTEDGKSISSQEWLMKHTIKVGGRYTKTKI